MYPKDIVIESLPQAIRVQVNRRLREGEPIQQIAQWLNTLPKVKRLMATRFEGVPITGEHLSCWMFNGYRIWVAQQEALEAALQFREDAAEIAQATGGLLADQLALCLTARVAVALREAASDQVPPGMQFQQLCELSAHVVALRKGDQGAQWLRIERDKLDSKRSKFEEEETARKKKYEKPNIDLKTFHLPPELVARVRAQIDRF